MRYFTDNPLERMMMQRPKGPKPDSAPQPPPGYRGCSHNNGADCAGRCYRELIITPKRKGAEKCDL